MWQRFGDAADDERARALQRVDCESQQFCPIAKSQCCLPGELFSLAAACNCSGSFRSAEDIVFGVGAEERVLDTGNESDFTQLDLLA